MSLFLWSAAVIGSFNDSYFQHECLKFDSVVFLSQFYQFLLDMNPLLTVTTCTLLLGLTALKEVSCATKKPLVTASTLAQSTTKPPNYEKQAEKLFNKARSHLFPAMIERASLEYEWMVHETKDPELEDRFRVTKPSHPALKLHCPFVELFDQHSKRLEANLHWS